MGPYCRFCGQRCFVHFPSETPEEAFNAYRKGVTIIATCPSGQAFESAQTGWNYSRIMKTIEQEQEAKAAQ